MQTSNQSRQPAKAKRLPALPFPDLPAAHTTPASLFWRAAWLRDVVEVQAFQEFLNSAAGRKTLGARKNAALANAMYASIGRLEDDARSSLNELVAAGGLLYAWLPESGAA